MDIRSEDDTTTTATAQHQQQQNASPMKEDNNTALLPRCALRWILQNNITSDAELAILSNACRGWRACVLEYVMELRTVVKDHGENEATARKNADSPTRYLLLPAMMRAFETKPQNNKSQGANIMSTPDKDHFCVAWFASEGIQQLPWSQLLREDDMLEKMLLEVHDTAASRDLTDSVLETNHSDSDAAEKERPKQLSTAAAAATTSQLEQQAAAAAAAATRPSTTFQWQRKATGVVLSNEWRGYREPVQVLKPFGYAPSFVASIFSTLRQQCQTSVLDTDGDDDYSLATFAVRGATVARPESYCLCMDRVGESFGDHATRLQRLKDRKDLRRSVLPRVIQRGGESTTTTPPVVQFLNVDKGSAVTMMTPALACGTLREPFTIFLVGIATEDGCFLSGLRRRFELGHLYPKDQLADITDSSAVCLFTEDSSPPSDDDEDDKKEAMDDEDDDDDDMIEQSSDDDDLGDAPRCNCVFEGVTEKLSVMEDQDERHGRLVRGVLGPGAWHCYTFVVDGVDSIIRIDGLEEPMEVHQKRDIPALLDGLTLGSDHCFGTSLCCGQGSPGEGEGAIAEVAVFGGRMDRHDMVTLESHLMNKHAIAPQTMEEPWLEDDLHRQARAMFHLVGNPRGKKVPLKYFAKSPNVAWKVYHPVTGRLIRKERIGCRSDESSSTFG
eukprot:scaffold2510_cov169-Amphora_coffeaeformis.AAC.44